MNESEAGWFLARMQTNWPTFATTPESVQEWLDLLAGAPVETGGEAVEDMLDTLTRRPTRADFVQAHERVRETRSERGGPGRFRELAPTADCPHGCERGWIMIDTSGRTTVKPCDVHGPNSPAAYLEPPASPEVAARYMTEMRATLEKARGPLAKALLKAAGSIGAEAPRNAPTAFVGEAASPPPMLTYDEVYGPHGVLSQAGEE